MDTISKGVTSPETHSTFKLRTALLLASAGIIALLNSACVSWPDIESNCDAYGVVETYQPMASRIHVQGLPHDELRKVCSGGNGPRALMRDRFIVKGCVIPTGNDSVYAYYAQGDRCAELHERCHARHGTRHTDRYMHDLFSDKPMPYCPKNQLSLTGS
ncbi:MAG: hypothetical protein KJN78_02440 [Gammaproteobacteria bacterium]|nr:hypothetical protein [Gammaproteobacteria bacterium]NNJ80310.1 hypothetical protein [Xanthomonadales bacterium]